MTIEEFQKNVLEINTQFMQFKIQCAKLTASGNTIALNMFKKDSQVNIEMLHACLDNAMVLLPEEKREKMSQALKLQTKNLKADLVKFCSDQYKQSFTQVKEARNKIEQEKSLGGFLEG